MYLYALQGKSVSTVVSREGKQFFWVGWKPIENEDYIKERLVRIE